MHIPRTPFPDSDAAALAEVRESAFLSGSPGVSETCPKEAPFTSLSRPPVQKAVVSLNSQPLEQCQTQEEGSVTTCPLK